MYFEVICGIDGQFQAGNSQAYKGMRRWVVSPLVREIRDEQVGAALPPAG